MTVYFMQLNMFHLIEFACNVIVDLVKQVQCDVLGVCLGFA